MKVTPSQRFVCRSSIMTSPGIWPLNHPIMLDEEMASSERASMFHCRGSVTPILVAIGWAVVQFFAQAEDAAVISSINSFPGYVTGRLHALTVSGNFAYLGIEGGVAVLDVSDPAAPVRKGFFQTSQEVRGLQLTGSTLYVAEASDGLIILDTTNPAKLVEISRYTAGSGAKGVKTVGEYAYLIHGVGCGLWSGIEVVNVSNPKHPVGLGRCFINGTLNTAAYDLDVTNNFAYVASFEAGLKIVDVSNSNNPGIVGSVTYIPWVAGSSF